LDNIEIIAAETISPSITASPQSSHLGYGSAGMRYYVLIVLTIVAGLSLLDRIAIGIVQEPVKQTFHLTDFQLGILGGPAFAILYSLLGIPIASLTERRNRITVISVSLVVWSVATAGCGLAASYLMLLASRLGVSVGEAGGAPQSQSVIVDYFPTTQRATALAIYALSTPIAALTAGFLGGWLAEAIGWRMMFVSLGAVGLLLALIVKATLPEPQRIYRAGEVQPSVGESLKFLIANHTFVYLVLGASMSCIVGYGLSQYLVSFLMRVHGLPLIRASQFNGMMFGVFAGIGTFCCGYLVDRFRGRWPRIGFWLPAWGMLAAVPFYYVGYTTNSFLIAGPALATGAMLNYFYVGSIFSVIFTIVRKDLRTIATAVAILMLNLVGYGLGPPVMGLLSDVFQHQALARAGMSVAGCSLSASSTADATCALARASGLQLAIVVCLVGYLGAGLLFLMSVRSAGRLQQAIVHEP
jgi:predicted MFS family arabinose efflux permease